MEPRRFPYLRLRIPSLLRHLQFDRHRGHRLNNRKPFYAPNLDFLSRELSLVGSKLKVASGINLIRNMKTRLVPASLVGQLVGQNKGSRHVIFLLIN